jgi:hypothetical protein
VKVVAVLTAAYLAAARIGACWRYSIGMMAVEPAVKLTDPQNPVVEVDSLWAIGRSRDMLAAAPRAGQQ